MMMVVVAVLVGFWRRGLLLLFPFLVAAFDLRPFPPNLFLFEFPMFPPYCFLYI